jgi:hypothetical protein
LPKGGDSGSDPESDDENEEVHFIQAAAPRVAPCAGFYVSPEQVFNAEELKRYEDEIPLNNKLANMYHGNSKVIMSLNYAIWFAKQAIIEGWS